LYDRVTLNTQEACGDRVRGQNGNQEYQDGDLDVFPEPGTHTQIRNDRDGAGLVRPEIDGSEQGEDAWPEVRSITADDDIFEFRLRDQA
jgi:hypothetical protein